jgi:dTDP-4-amino-4,6-dideoxygalactose transaminase
VDMERVADLAKAYGCRILEDSCHAPGGYFIDHQGNKSLCGSGAYADAAIFSFHPVKHIACGEGGMVTTAHESLYKHLLRLRTHGITREPDLLHENPGGWYYEMQELGFNYRLSDIQAALGRSQLQRLGQGIALREQQARRYTQALAELPIGLPPHAPGHAWHIYVIRTERRAELYNYLHSQQIRVQVHYIPVHYQPYYQQLGWKKGDFPRAERFYDQCLSLPLYVGLEEEEQTYVIDKVRKFFND